MLEWVMLDNIDNKKHNSFYKKKKKKRGQQVDIVDI